MSAYLSVLECVRVYVYLCMCVYICTHVCTGICGYMCMLSRNTYMCISVYIFCVHICLYIYMYVHMCGYSCIHPPQLLLLPVSFCSDFPNQLISPKVASSSSSSANSQTEKGSFQYFSVTVLRPPNPDHCDHDWTGLCHMPGVSQ